jgi:hypothetical protein
MENWLEHYKNPTLRSQKAEDGVQKGGGREERNPDLLGLL